MSITNKCILKCPSCPTGRFNMHRTLSGEGAIPLQYASLTRCEQIFEKVFRLYGKQLFYLHIWNEPLIHPDIIGILQALHHFGHTAYISSNLNVRVDWGALLREPALKTLVISMSGCTQEVYEKGHRGGNVALVLENIAEMGRHTKQSTTRVLVNFHKYTDNAQDLACLEKLCNHTGIEVGAYPAVALQENIHNSVSQNLTESWKTSADIVELVAPRLSLTPFPFAPVYGLDSVPCHSQTNILVLDHEGQICTCTHKEPAVVTRLGDFLAMSEEAISQAKLNCEDCEDCRRLGLHMAFVFACFFEKPCHNEQKIMDFLAEKQPDPRFAGKPLYIFGAGMTGAAVGPLLRHHGYNVCGYIDENPTKIGTNLHGLPIFSLIDVKAELPGSWVLDSVRSQCFKIAAGKHGIVCQHIVSAEDFIAAIMNK